jgi:hypothetical protein
MREWHNPPSPINRSRKRRVGGRQQHLHSQVRQGGGVREDVLREGGEVVAVQIPVVAQGKEVCGVVRKRKGERGGVHNPNPKQHRILLPLWDSHCACASRATQYPIRHAAAWRETSFDTCSREEEEASKAKPCGTSSPTPLQLRHNSRCPSHSSAWRLVLPPPQHPFCLPPHTCKRHNRRGHMVTVLLLLCLLHHQD